MSINEALTLMKNSDLIEQIYLKLMFKNEVFVIYHTDICSHNNKHLIVIDEESQKKVRRFVLDMVTEDIKDHH